ncbi:MAG: ATP-binding protein [Anaerolineae bacterium]|nr:ATP-binding protein [Anaerolineae bacterium]
MADPTVNGAIGLREYALAAVAAQIVDRASAKPTTSAEVRFLQTYYELCGGEGWYERFVSYLNDPSEADRPLCGLAYALELTLIEIVAVALALNVEDDLLAGRALTFVQAPIGGSRPTLGLIASLLPDGQSMPPTRIAGGAAISSGLLQLIGDHLPLAERMVAVPLPICLALNGQDGVLSATHIGTAANVPIPSSIKDEAARRAEGLCGTPRQMITLRAGTTEEGCAVAVKIAAAMHLRPLFIETDKVTGLAPLLLLRGLLPVYCLDLAPGEQKHIAPIPHYQGAVVCLCGLDGWAEMTGYDATTWNLPVPSPDERYQLWRAALDDDALAWQMARDHRHHSERIAHLAQLAGHHAWSQARSRPNLQDIHTAMRTGDGMGLDALAQPIKEAIPDAALVLPSNLKEQLDLLVLRCLARDRLVDDLGISANARYSPGVRALLIGPSGTGKTLAAGWLATRLGLPLFKVDLASITSKYIGETEKNLAQLLARAERAEVVLLFDEADSLFGKRTDVKDSNDRFANAQTNYLLQRIETFDGIVLLTSNNKGRFDSAFSRRLDMIIDFPLPNADERRALWVAHLGSGHCLSPRALNQLASVVDFAGGHIRNAVLTAAVLSQAKGRPIHFPDVLRGVEIEYDKLGRQLPTELDVDLGD